MSTIKIGTAINSNVVGSVTGGTLVAGVHADEQRQSLTALLSQLSVEVNRASHALPAKVATELATSMEELTHEVASLSPDKPRVSRLLTQIADRTKAATQFAAPIVDLLKNIADVVARITI